MHKRDDDNLFHKTIITFCLHFQISTEYGESGYEYFFFEVLAFWQSRYVQNK